MAYIIILGFLVAVLYLVAALINGDDTEGYDVTFTAKEMNMLEGLVRKELDVAYPAGDQRIELLHGLKDKLNEAW